MPPSGCEFADIAEQNTTHRQLATQLSACMSFYNVKSYTKIGLMMNEQKLATKKKKKITFKRICAMATMHI